MRLVVDASVAVKWIIPEEHEAAAEAILLDGVERVAPDFLLVEVANVLRTKLSRGQVELAQARTGLDFVSSAMTTLIADRDLFGRAFEIAAEMRHPVYDCLYIACAERESVQMVTADRRLAEGSAASPYHKHIQVLPT